MKFILALPCLISLALASGSTPEKLQIGVKHKVPEAECTRKTENGDQISVHYRGSLLETGIQFDASYDRGKPFTFELGAGQVIPGWDQGLRNMCVGEVRKLVIPSSLGYGEKGAGGVIPPNAALVFEVKLEDIVTGRDEL